MRRLIYSQLPLPLGTLPRRAAYLWHGNGLGKCRECRVIGSVIIPNAVLPLIYEYIFPKRFGRDQIAYRLHVAGRARASLRWA
jgi:hypothetical protein